MTTTYTKDDLPVPVDEMPRYAKIDSTPMFEVRGPFTVITQEGSYDLPEGWEGFIAVDKAGYPYPIERNEQYKTYEVYHPRVERGVRVILAGGYGGDPYAPRTTSTGHAVYWDYEEGADTHVDERGVLTVQDVDCKPIMTFAANTWHSVRVVRSTGEDV